MGDINIPPGEQEAILAIDDVQLSRLIDQAIDNKSSAPLSILSLGRCGPYVTAQLREFEADLRAYATAKASKKLSETLTDARRAGSRLANSVGQMKFRVEQERKEGERFHIDDLIMTPYQFTQHLSVQVGYRWRASIDHEWQHGSITFIHEADLRPDYTLPQPSRKPSRAKQEQDTQDKLYREWDHLRRLGLESLKDFFRSGGEAGAVPKAFRVKTGSHGRGLNNYSADFWSARV